MQGVPQKDLNKVLLFLQQHPSDESDECYSIVLKIGLSLSAKKKERAITQKEHILKFTKKEIDSMPEPIRILLLYGEYEIKYAVYNNSYHASFRRDGYNIQVSSKNLDTLRKKFLKAASEYVRKEKVQKEDTSTPFFKDFVNEWLNIRAVKIKESTYHGYVNVINSQLLPTFGEQRLNKITRADVQAFLTNLLNDEKFRTAQKAKVMLNSVFELAVEDFGIKSPMAKIELAHYEVKKGRSLSKEEEKTTVDYCILHKDNPACSAILILLYSGMRVGELASAVLYDNYIECETKKTRKGYAKEFRKIPLSPMFQKILPYIDFEKAKTASSYTVNNTVKKIIAGRHTHELRYTFITRAKECGCNLELVMLWDGHKYDGAVKSSAVDRGYTTYSDEYYFGEIEKINYES